MVIPGVTEQDVVLSVAENLGKMRVSDKKLWAMIATEVESLLSVEGPAPQLRKRLGALIEEAAEVLSEVSACRKGCDHCCKMAVTISEHEAKAIGKAIGIAPLSPSCAVDRDAEVDRWMRVSCPFLKKHTCTIYEDRPSPCRTHFNVSSYPDLCDLINNPGGSVPNFDFTDVWGAQMLVDYRENHGVVYADIREFFPYGRELVFEVK